ncbi:MAG: hypothetical protein KDB27_23095 [Planctomycetales bacterium]|nr:hypothetical protein [Planctomycetales bacterium]
MRSKTFLVSFFTVLICGSSVLMSQESEDKKPDDGDAAEVVGRAEFDALSKQLSNSVFEGHFTIDGQETPPKKEQYFLKKVTKLPVGDLWLIQTRIKYGDHDVTVPLSLPIKWSDKTPVITVDNVTVPGLGTFDARVLIADGKYAGTWRHGKVGGHLFGTINSQNEQDGNKAESKEGTADDESAPSDESAEDQNEKPTAE